MEHFEQRIKFVTSLHLRYDMRYPVGRAMWDNLPVINIMADMLMEQLEDGESVDLWCRGSSGSIIAGVISQRLIENRHKCSISHVKKRGESSHNNGLNNRRNAKKVIVDDFTCTGATLRAIYTKMRSHLGGEPEVDILLLSGDLSGADINFCPKVVICGMEAYPAMFKDWHDE